MPLLTDFLASLAGIMPIKRDGSLSKATHFLRTIALTLARVTGRFSISESRIFEA
jgi:hypothetical protein